MLKRIYMDDDKIHILGRTTIDDDRKCNLFWTASGVEFCFHGKAVGMEFSVDYDIYAPWISVFLDEVCLIRMPLNRGKQKVIFCENMADDMPHRIRIIKDVQAMHDDPGHSLSMDGVLLDGVLNDPPCYKYKLEFVGDSITSAEGAIGAQREMDWLPAYFCPANSYPLMVADAMQADYRVISQSGWGVYKSWDGKRDCAIPEYYQQVCGLLTGVKNEEKGAGLPYDFNEWQPDAVIINLGTNDDNCCKEESELDKVASCASDFLKIVRYCNPDAHIVWAYGMLGSNMKDTLQKGIEIYKNESHDRKVHFLELADTTEETKGARLHPGKKSHQDAKELIMKLLKEILE